VPFDRRRVAFFVIGRPSRHQPDHGWRQGGMHGPRRAAPRLIKVALMNHRPRCRTNISREMSITPACWACYVRFRNLARGNNHGGNNQRDDQRERRDEKSRTADDETRTADDLTSSPSQLRTRQRTSSMGIMKNASPSHNHTRHPSRARGAPNPRQPEESNRTENRSRGMNMMKAHNDEDTYSIVVS